MCAHTHITLKTTTIVLGKLLYKNQGIKEKRKEEKKVVRAISRLQPLHVFVTQWYLISYDLFILMITITS
jgi:hypothetical protein